MRPRSSAPPLDWRRPPTTSDETGPTERFRITHPFHPYAGREFGVVAWRCNWAEERVYFQDGQNRLRSVPSQWTNLASDDPVVIVGAGRAHFRVVDLLELAVLLQELRS